ncbi:MAG: HIRAN domain-containing protein [Promethearchaeota archaeon]
MDELDEYNHLLAKFVDPLIKDKNKNEILLKIQNLFKILLRNSLIPYYCSKCKKNHFKGKKYQNHKQIFSMPEIFPLFPKIPSHSPDIIYYQQIVGIYYTGNGSLIQNLPKGTLFKLKCEPENRYDSHAVSVWYESYKLGYIPRHSSVTIFNALSSEKVTCIFGKYRPSFSRRGSYWDYDRESNFSPERADITIHIFNPQKFHDIMDGFIEMISASVNLPDFQGKIVDALYTLGYRTIEILENQVQTANMKNILSKLYDKFKIQIKDSEFSILL